MISYMTSYMISYHIKDLMVPSPEAMAFQIERVASCLGPSTVELTLPQSHSMQSNVQSCPLSPWLGTRLFSRMVFSSPAVYSTSRLGGICSFCPKFSPIHAASSEGTGSQQIIGWDLRNGYSSHPCPASWQSSAQTTSGCPERTSQRAGLRRFTSKHSLPA
jgi:hypothetical protein